MDAFESFNLWQIPAILAGLSCYVVRFGIISAGIAMIASGIAFFFSGGNPTRLAMAKKAFLYSMAGAFIVYGVYTIILTTSNILIGTTDLPWVPLTCS